MPRSQRPSPRLDLVVTVSYDAPRTPQWTRLWRRLLAPIPPATDDVAGLPPPMTPSPVARPVATLTGLFALPRRLTMTTSSLRAFSARRQALGLSRQAVSFLAHVPVHVIQRSEDGRGRPMTEEERARLALIYDAIEAASRQAAALAWVA
jgi:hypothetical protein